MRVGRDQLYIQRAQARARARLLSRYAAGLRPGTFVELSGGTSDPLTVDPQWGRLIKVEDDSGLYVFIETTNGEPIVVGNPTGLRELSLLEVLALESGDTGRPDPRSS